MYKNDPPSLELKQSIQDCILIVTTEIMQKDPSNIRRRNLTFMVPCIVWLMYSF